MNTADSSTPVMSIGALSRAADVPTSTIRTWERRYGFPTATRGPGGHREYPADIVPHLVLLKRALDAGHRPGQVMKLSVQQLQAMIGPSPLTGGVSSANTTVVARLLEATRALDAAAFHQVLATEFSRHRATDFLDDHLGPFVVAIGDAWERGELEVFHEHFVSDLVCRFLATHCREAAQPRPRGVAVLATLPSQRHVIGLHMAAVVLTNCGWDPVFLGADTPLGDIVRCTVESGASAVCISAATGSKHEELGTSLAELGEALPPNAVLICGGGGAVAVDGVLVVESLRDLDTWAVG